MKKLTVFFFLLLAQLSFQWEYLVKEFEAKIVIQSRSDKNLQYSGTIQKTNTGINMIAMDKYKNTYIYSNGKLLIKSEKGSRCEDIAPPVPNNISFKEFKRNNTLDREVNKCLGKKFIIPYEGEFFIFCEVNGELNRIIGQNVVINILKFTNKFQHKIQTSDAKDCQKNNRRLFKQTKPWFDDEMTCQLGWLKDQRYCQDFKIEPTKTCYFFHGSGEPATQEPSGNFTSYWGKINEYTPHCKIRKFIREETIQRGFNSEEIQKKFCLYLTDAASPFLIKDKIIYTHSMGGLILSTAIHKKFCDLDVNTSKWFIVATPFQGSHVVPFVII
jgi:hypothetical protein